MFESFDFFYTLHMFFRALPLAGCAGFLLGLIYDVIWYRGDWAGLKAIVILVTCMIIGLNLSGPTYRLYRKYGDVYIAPFGEQRSSVVFYK